MSVLNSTFLHSVAGEDGQHVASAVGVTAVLATAVVYYVLNSKDGRKEFQKLGGIQLCHGWNFFRRRYDFIFSQLQQNPGRSFAFNLLHHRVIVLTGEDGRQAFYSNPHLSFQEGYNILSGVVRALLAINATPGSS